MGISSALDISDLPAPDDISDLPAPTASAPVQKPAQSSSIMAENPVNRFIEGYFRQGMSSVAGSVAGGLRGLWDLALGRGAAQAQSDLEATQRATQIAMLPGAQAAGAEASSSEWNPLNWPGMALSHAGKLIAGDIQTELPGTSPAILAGLEAAPTATVLLSPLAARANLSPYQVAAEESAPGQSISAAAADGGALPKGAPEPLGAPIEGGLPKESQQARADTLARVGIQKARESAIQGDAKAAATDYLMTKYDQPAGRAAAAQFQSERDALAAHTENLIGNAGGTVGMEEDALANRGATIAAPFDKLRDWFSQRTRQLYQEADQRASGGALTGLESVDDLLESPGFQNTLGAKNQQGLLTSVKNQLQFMRQNAQNPEGFSAGEVEQFRQWLNQVSSYDNNWAIRQLKGAADQDVTSAAGEDIYAQARAIRTLQAKTLENPNGISQLFDVDPNTPINRSTPLEKIPDKLTQLPVDQYANVIKTLQSMPEELQPDVQAAIGEIKGHLLNKVLQAGTQTSRGVGGDIWGTDRVANVLRTNAAKFRVAFQGDPEAQAGLEDLSNAGQILRVNPSYPGADAQAANAMKRGLISRTIGHLGGSAGAAAGAAIAGPVGAAAGGALGESAGLAAGQKASERAALKAWGSRVRQVGQGSESP